MRGANDEFRQRAADTIVHALRKLNAMRRTEQVELSLVVPMLHHREAIEQRHVVLLRHRACGYRTDCQRAGHQSRQSAGTEEPHRAGGRQGKTGRENGRRYF